MKHSPEDDLDDDSHDMFLGGLEPNNEPALFTLIIGGCSV